MRLSCCWSCRKQVSLSPVRRRRCTAHIGGTIHNPKLSSMRLLPKSPMASVLMAINANPETTPQGKQFEPRTQENIMGFGRGLLLWLLGIRLPVIILLALFWHN